MDKKYFQAAGKIIIFLSQIEKWGHIASKICVPAKAKYTIVYTGYLIILTEYIIGQVYLNSKWLICAKFSIKL
jgi:hypothetical protein